MKERINHISRIGPGILFGVIIGLALDNIGLWISLGLVIGVALDYEKKKKSPRNNKNKTE